MFEIRKFIADETTTTFKVNGEIHTEKMVSTSWILSMSEDSTESIIFNLVDEEKLIVVTWNSGVVDFIHTAEISDNFWGRSVNITFAEQYSPTEECSIDSSTATKINEYIMKQLKWLYGNTLQENDNAWAQMLSSIGGLIMSLVPNDVFK